MPSLACHSSPFAGSWYPGDRTRLAELLAEVFERSERRTGAGMPRGAYGCVVPHAGLAYSGCVAAAVYRQFRAAPPRRFVLIGFAHRGSPAGAWIPRVDAYRTPMGETAVDRAAADELLAGGVFGALAEEKLCDHSLEIQLPLIEYTAPGAVIVPVYVSALGVEKRRQAARELARLAGPDTVFLASSDFTHYGSSFHYLPFPVNRQTQSRLRRLDEDLIEAAGSLEPDLFLQVLDGESATVCGREPIALLLAAMRELPDAEEIFQTALDYETSGEMTGDFSHSVSYAALGYFPWSAWQLDAEDSRLLSESARATLHNYQQTGAAAPVPPSRTTPGTERRAGAFVTLHKNRDLRGCVGRVSSDEPLGKVIPEMTLAAALEDTRFEPLRPEETGIRLEISVLSPMKRLADAGGFRIGRDGAYLRAGGLSGLLLPQVAEGRDWTARDFLAALARKARMSPNVYQDPQSRLYVFRAQIIH